MNELVTARGEAFVSLFLRLRARSLDDPRIFSALEQTPKYHFIDPVYAPVALQNCMIPIECGEYIERLDEQIMVLHALHLKKHHRVLEIGTGSGFSAALMSRLVSRVMTVERYKLLCELALQRFRLLSLDNIVVTQQDAAYGLTKCGPFDRIILWLSQETEPEPFINFLAEDGILLAPIGPPDNVQTMICYQKKQKVLERFEMFQIHCQPFIQGVAAVL